MRGVERYPRSRLYTRISSRRQRYLGVAQGQDDRPQQLRPLIRTVQSETRPGLVWLAADNGALGGSR